MLRTRDKIFAHCEFLEQQGIKPTAIIITKAQAQDMIVKLHTEDYLENGPLLRELEDFVESKGGRTVSLFGLTARLGSALAVY